MARKKNFHILLVDDELDFSTSLEVWFQSQGYSVKVVSNGLEALSFLKTDTPNVILLDIYMPGMDGIQTLKRIRGFNSGIPVILLASKPAEDLRVEAYKAGANGFLDKTMDFYKIEHIINSIVRVAVREKSPIAKAKNKIIKEILRTRRTKTSALFVVVAGLFIFVWLSTSPFARVCFGNKCLGVELAVTAAERRDGLMFRKNLSNNRGMLFIFSEEGLHSFWMKNTYIPLDIIWINKDKAVVDIARNARPCVGEDTAECPAFRAVTPCKYVLEANAGFAEENNIAIKDKVSFKWIY